VISKRFLTAVIALLLVVILGLALFWNPLPLSHERELPAAAPSPTNQGMPQ
jgi:hypothetical protein